MPWDLPSPRKLGVGTLSGRCKKTTTPRMHYNPDWREAVHAGSPSLPGNRKRAFLYVPGG